MPKGFTSETGIDRPIEKEEVHLPSRFFYWTVGRTTTITKLCKKCGEVKHVSEFSKDASKKCGLSSRCKVCKNNRYKEIRAEDPGRYSEYSRAWRNRRDPDASKLASRKHNLKAKFGITIEEYDSMLESQGGVCKICGTDIPGKKRFAVDHCHNTGKIRGLLCNNCNSGIGKLKDSAELCMKAAEYLCSV